MAVQQSGLGESHDLIIAVDGQRTRNLNDFMRAIGEAEAGEIVYLTVVSEGRRNQVRVELPRAALAASRDGRVTCWSYIVGALDE